VSEATIVTVLARRVLTLPAVFIARFPGRTTLAAQTTTLGADTFVVIVGDVAIELLVAVHVTRTRRRDAPLPFHILEIYLNLHLQAGEARFAIVVVPASFYAHEVRRLAIVPQITVTMFAAPSAALPRVLRADLPKLAVCIIATSRNTTFDLVAKLPLGAVLVLGTLGPDALPLLTAKSKLAVGVIEATGAAHVESRVAIRVLRAVGVRLAVLAHTNALPRETGQIAGALVVAPASVATRTHLFAVGTKTELTLSALGVLATTLPAFPAVQIAHQPVLALILAAAHLARAPLVVAHDETERFLRAVPIRRAVLAFRVVVRITPVTGLRVTASVALLTIRTRVIVVPAEADAGDALRVGAEVIAGVWGIHGRTPTLFTARSQKEKQRQRQAESGQTVSVSHDLIRAGPRMPGSLTIFRFTAATRLTAGP
jgi:hypothetical protein